jgi:hypothetical protein
MLSNDRCVLDVGYTNERQSHQILRELPAWWFVYLFVDLFVHLSVLSNGFNTFRNSLLSTWVNLPEREEFQHLNLLLRLGIFGPYLISQIHLSGVLHKRAIVKFSNILYLFEDILWGVMSCGLVEIFKRFGANYCLHNQRLWKASHIKANEVSGHVIHKRDDK